MTSSSLSLADALALAPAADDPHRVAWRLVRGSLPGLAVVVALIAAWLAWAPLSGAVRAPGVVKPELDRRTLQHLEGGIVRTVPVREGQAVRRGEVLLVIGDARNEATLAMLATQIAGMQARIARAEAELQLQDRLEPPAPALPAWGGLVPNGMPAQAMPGVDPALMAREAWARERLLFDARRRTLDEQRAALDRQIAQLRQSAGALGAQTDQALMAVGYARQELALNEQLAADGYVSPARVLTLQRQLVDTRSRVQASQGQAADAQARIAALQQASAELRGQYQQRAADERRDAETRLLDLQQQLRPALDQAERQALRAPVDGRVMQLRAKTPGLSVGPREPLLDLAPTEERLIVEARVAPEDIDHVRPGATVQLHVTAFDARAGGPLAGRVGAVAPDAVVARDGMASWYVAQLEIDPAALVHRPELQLQPGMQVEAYIATVPRSTLAYLLGPLSQVARRAMREP